MRFILKKPLKPAQIKYLNAFSLSKRKKRMPAETRAPDPIRQAVGLPPGPDGAYYIGNSSSSSSRSSSLLPEEADMVGDEGSGVPLPAGQPSDTCCWTASEDGRWIEMRDGIWLDPAWRVWLQYVIDHFLRRWHNTIRGIVALDSDKTMITELVVENDKVEVRGRYRAPAHSVPWWLDEKAN
jgi:hypothetical protein